MLSNKTIETWIYTHEKPADIMGSTGNDVDNHSPEALKYGVRHLWTYEQVLRIAKYFFIEGLSRY